jgi:hypothetical protein
VNAATRQHTPGPYVRDGLFILTQRIENTTGIGELVAKLPEFESRKFVGESEADYKARFRRFCATGDLLASAPDLLAALEKALESIEGQAELLRHCGASYGIGATLAQARAAIAKATEGGAM